MGTFYRAEKKNLGLLFLAFFVSIIGLSANLSWAASSEGPLIKKTNRIVYPFEHYWEPSLKFLPCDGISSTLPCADIGVSLPFALTFSGSEGGLVDGSSTPAEIGFTMAQKPSAILSSEQTFSVEGGYAPSRLEVVNGKLILTPTKGIYYNTPSASSETNSQLNALGVGIESPSRIINIEVELDQPSFNLSSGNSSQQAGIWYGLDEDHVLKIVTSKSGGDFSQKIQLQVEDLDHPTVGSQLPEINTPNFSTSGISTIKLRLEINPVDKKVTGFYALDAGNEVEVGEIALRDLFFDGVDHDENASTANQVYSGVFGTLRRADLIDALTYSFDNFSVSEIQSSANDIETFSFAEQASVASLDTESHTVTIEVENGTVLSSLIPTVTVSGFASISPESGIAQDFSNPVNYTVTAEDGTEQIWTVSVIEADPPLTKFIEDFDSYGTGVLTTVGSSSWEKENGNGVDIPVNNVGLSAGTSHSLSFTEGPHTTDYIPLQDNPIDLIGGQPFYFATYFKVNSLDAGAGSRIRTALRIDDEASGDDWIRLQIAKDVDQLIARVGLLGAESNNGFATIDSNQTIQFIVKGVWNGTDEIGYEWSIDPKLIEGETAWITAGNHTVSGTPQIGRLFISSVGTNDGLVGPIRVSTDYSEVVTEELNVVIPVEPFEAKINFQDEPTTPPNGYQKDFGKQFGFSSVNISGTIYSYGWKSKATDNPIDITDGSNGAGRNRISGTYGSVSDEEKLAGTLVHFQGDNIRGNTGGGSLWAGENRGGESFWEMEVPNGIYEVTVGLGDKDGANLDSRHSATIEGYTVIPAFEPTAGETRTGTIIVEVTDGLLTMTGLGGYNSKVTHIEIAPSTGTPVSGELTFEPSTLSTELLPGESGTFTATISGAGAGTLGIVIDDVENLIAKNNTSFNEWFSIPTTLALGELTFQKEASALTAGESHSDKFIVSAAGFKPAELDVTLNVVAENVDTPCSPFSLLPCDQIVTSLPVNLTFDGAQGGLEDANSNGTGFTMVDPHSGVRLATDTPVTYANVNGYEPSKLNQNEGNLMITASKGIAFIDNNAQVNSLGVGIQNLNQAIVLETKILDVNTGGSSAQAGLWFGLDDQNFVKLNVNSNANIEVRKETNDLTDTDGVTLDQIQSDDVFTPGDDVVLRMVIDPVEETITGYYSVNDAPFVQLTKTELSELTLPTSYISGKTINGTVGTASFAGVYATYRNGSAPFDATFDYFTVEEEVVEEPLTLSFEQSVLNFTGEVGSVIPNQSVNLLASEGTPTVGLSDDPTTEEWLILPTSPVLGALDFGVNTNLPAGYYTTTVIATDEPDTQGYENAEITINLTLTDPETPELDLKVNFSDPETAAPQGYLRDAGNQFGDRGNGYNYGWLDASTSAPADLLLNGRNREDVGVSLLDNTLIHMQYGNVSTNAANGYLPDAKWEVDVPNGTYTVLVAVGDPDVDGSIEDTPFHTIVVEGTIAINRYEATGPAGSSTRGTTGTVTVNVSDGKLTLEPGNGFNTKIRYVEISSEDIGSGTPSVLGVTPEDGATNVSVNPTISANNLFLPNGGNLDNSTITSSTVTLTKQGAASPIVADLNGTGGGDAINLVPRQPLEANTTYIFEINGVKDVTGVSLEPFTSSFTTGDGNTGGPSTDLDNVSFSKIGQVGSTGKYSTLVFGPDGLLYGLEIGGDIKRWTVNSDGTLSNQEVLNAWKTGYSARAAIGFVFDPASTPSNLIAYITHQSGALNNAPDWDGKISKLTGPQLATEQLLVTNLPRSSRDHLTNSLAFRNSEPNVLYFNQGSNSAAGAYDNGWRKDERMLSGATLRLDLTKLPSTLPLDVQTTDDIQAIINADENSPTLNGMYNPYYTNAALTLYATGIRNAYDLVWHSNGQLYVPTNGTAAGGTTPSSIDGMRRPDGSFYDTSGDPSNYPSIQGFGSVDTQRDWLFRINPSEPIGYYGHPNPLRGEFVLNRGDLDDDNPLYNGVQPDVNYRGAAFDFEFNKSPNGVIEYKSNAENGNLQGALLVVRYSGGSDIIALVPDGPGGDIQTSKVGIPGFTGFGDPLDLVEDVNSGNIYVSDYGRSEIILLKPNNEASPKPSITVSTEKIVGDAIAAGSETYTEEVIISNLGNAELTDITSSITGANSSDFEVTNLPTSINVQNSGSFQVVFNPSSNGPKSATLTISGFNADPVTIELSGLGKQGLGGSNEPSLQWILDSHLGAGVINVGDADPSNNIITTGASTNYNTLIGDEVDIQAFQRATDGPIEIEVLSVYGPTSNDPVVAFGWYLSGNAGSVEDIFTVSNSPASNGQTLNPVISGALEFDPGNASFGFVSRWPAFQNRQLFSEDALNTFSGAIPHHVRVYPLPGESNAYIIATEEHISGFDYQDVVVIVRNIQPYSGVVPTEGCSPISTLDCEDIDVTLPFTLNFSGSEGGMANTGFTMVDNPSARIAADGPISNPSVPGFEPSKLSIENGNLTINANNGIAFVTNGTATGTSSDVNSQINTLGAGFDADAYGNFSINTTLVDQFSDGSADAEQAGIWFGLNEDNFVKLIVNNSGQVELRREVAGQSVNADQQLTAAIPNINSSNVALRLYVDIENSLLTGYYSINSGAEVSTGSLPLPSVYLSGNSAYNNLSFAGVFASKRRELVADVNYSFSDFSISPDNDPVQPTFGPLRINFSRAEDAAPAGYERDSGLPFGDRGNGYSYGWFNTDGVTPLDISANTRNRDIAGASFIQNTLIHMQYQDGVPPGGTPNGTMVEGIWEVSVPNGTYSVTVGVGDLNVDGDPATFPSHTVNVEGVNAVNQFVPTGTEGASTRITSATVSVVVVDGQLTIDAAGGFNTKIHSLEITQTSQNDQPYFTNVTPANFATNVRINDFQINVEIYTPEGYELDKNSLANNVNLYEVSTAGAETLVPSNSNDTGGGDAITLTPLNLLKENTRYIFRISGVEANLTGDLEDRLDFLDFESTFVTGSLDDGENPIRDLTGVEFTKVNGGSALGDATLNERYSSLAIGPDGKLYGSNINGTISRWVIAEDGTLTDLEILTPALTGAPHPVTEVNNNNSRMIIGFAFGPEATAENLVAYITHSFASETSGPEWDGILSKLSGPNLETVEDLVTHLPRSSKDHLTNSLTFDESGIMYITQGSNSAGGAPDPAWSNRPERLLAAAILKVELNKLPGTLPLSAFTTDDISVINAAPASGLTMSNGTYNPYSSDSPVTIFATGVRNAYDLVWHSNGWLYIPTNGTAGNNNNSPNSPAYNGGTLARRIDGLTNIPTVPAMNGGETQKDWLFKTKGGSYHGHPNPLRGEFVLNHGGQTYSGLPGQEEASYKDVNKYPSTVFPDPNYRQPAFDFGKNKSPNGVIEYKSDAFGGKLQGLLMVVRFSGQDDILPMDPKSNGDIAEAYGNIPGLQGFDDPLDLVEDVKTGNIYVSEYDRDGSGVARLTLVRANIPATPPALIEAEPNEMIFEIEVNNGGNNGSVPGRKTDTQSVVVTNESEEVVTITGASIRNDEFGHFGSISPTGSTTLAPGESVTYAVTYAPALNNSNLGYHGAELVLATDNNDQEELIIGLHALKKNGFEGGNEPPLQDVVNTLGIGIDVGWTQLANGTSPTLEGEEVAVQQWVKAGPGEINITPVGRYSPAETLPFGWYTNNSGSVNLNEVGVLAGDLPNAQTLYPEIISGDDFFDPQSMVFGIYVESIGFGRINYTEDVLNETSGGQGPIVPHRVRTYPVRDRDGVLVPNSYLVNFEDASNGDYQDYMFIIDNVIPFEDGALRLTLDPETTNISTSVNEADVISTQVTLTANGPVTESEISLTSNSPWLTVPESYVLGTPFNVTIDKSGLGLGTFQAIVTASAPNYVSDQFIVKMTITNDPEFSYQFNFQLGTDLDVSPAGWIDDIGGAFGTKTTEKGPLNFGWVLPGTNTPTSAAENGRNRDTGASDDPLLSTFNIIGHNTPSSYPLRDWMVELPNGTYAVNISVGDPEYADSYHKLDVNGVTVVDYDQENNPIAGEDWYNNTETVQVTDGVMRLSLGSGGANAKPNYIRIAPYIVSEQPPLVTASFDGLMTSTSVYRGPVSITVNASDNSQSEEGIVRVEYILNGGTKTPYTDAIAIADVGDYTLTVEAEDGNGNVTTQSFIFTIEPLTGAQLRVESMTKIPNTNRSFPADDYYTFYRFRNPGEAAVHDANTMRLHNEGTNDLVITEINISDENDYSYEILPSGSAGVTLPLTIPAGGSRDVLVTFLSDTGNGSNGIFKETISIVSNADNGGENISTLHGGFAPQPEGGDEIDAQEVFDAFGFLSSMRSSVNDNGENTGVYIPQPSSAYPIPANIDAGYEGDMILSDNFVQADPTKPVIGLQLSALHGGPGSNGAQFIQPKEVGNSVVGGMNFSHGPNWYQTLLPKSGGTSSTTINADIAQSITGPFRISISGYPSSGGNNNSGNRPDLLGLRIYKAIDREGNVIPNEYIALQDFVQNGCGAGSANCDWNDNTFYFINIRPEAVPTAEALEDMNVNEGIAFSNDISAFFDKGYPGNKLSYSLELVGGGDVPVWISISDAGVITGTAPADAASSYAINVIATDLNGLITGSPFNINVNKAPIPVAEADVDKGWVPLTVNFTGDNSSDDSAIDTYQWNFGDGSAAATTANSTHTYASEGTYEVSFTVTDDTGLDSTAVLSVIVKADGSPLAFATADVTEGMSPLTVAFDGSSSVSSANITEYLWDFGNGDTATGMTTTYTYTNKGDYTATLTITDANSLTDQVEIQINVLENNAPIAVATSSTTEGTVPLEVVFDASESSDIEGELSYAWDFGDGSTSTAVSPTHTFTNKGIYTVVLTVTDEGGLTASDELEIVVNPQPSFELRLNAGGPQVTHEGNVFAADQYFSSTSKSYENTSATVPTLYQTERSSSQRAYNYAIPVPNGTYTVNLHFAEIYFGANGGGPAGTGNRVFDVTLEGNLVLDNFDINAEVGPQTVLIKEYEITVTDGMVNIALSALDAVGGNDQPKLSALEIIGLGADNEDPVAVINYSPEEPEVNETITFDGSASTDDGTISEYSWTFGDGSTSDLISPSHTYSTAGTYEVELLVTDHEGSSNSTTVSIVVSDSNVAPVAVASATPNPAITGETVNFVGSNSTDEGELDYAWDFGDESSSTVADPTHVYAEPGVYDVTLTVTDAQGLQDTETIAVDVLAANVAPVAIASAAPNTAFVGDVIEFTGSNSEDEGVLNYAWDFGDTFTSTAADVAHVYLAAGTYTVTLEVTDAEGLTDQTTLSIEIFAPNAAPIAVAGADKEAVFTGEQVSFNGSSSTDDVEVVSYAWDFKDGSTADVADPTHTFTVAGTYDVELTVTDEEGLSNSTVIQIVVSIPKVDPIAIASATPNPAEVGEEVQFTGTNSTDDSELTYLWNFGDGEVSALPDPVHTYANAGDYLVTLTVIDEDLNVNLTSINVEVVEPEFDFSMYLNTGSSVTTAYNDRVFVGDKTISSSYYNSASTRNTTSVGLEELFKTSRTNSTGQLTYSIPVPNGVYRVTTYHTEQYYGVVSSGGNGKRVFDINMEGVKVREALDLYQESGNGAVIQVFEDITVFDGVLTIEFSSTVSSPVVSGIAIEGDYYEGNFAPKAALSYSPTVVINAGSEVSFSGIESSDDVGIVGYAWDFGDGNTSSLAEPSHTYVSEGNYLVTLVVTDSEGLSDSNSVELSVTAALPEFDFSLYLNTGSSVSTAYNDRVFVGDKTISSNYYNSASTRNTTSVGLEELFKTSRTNSTGQLTYSIPVPNGVYRVTTYHTEQYYGVVSSGGNGKRVFDINMEGVKVREALDLYQESGNGAVIQVFEDITVFDGVLTIEFSSTVSSPVVSGIAIEGDYYEGNFAPKAALSYSPTVVINAGSEVSFSGIESSDDVGIVGYAWDFGDGNTSSLAEPSHTYVSEGNYLVTLVVTDSEGLSDSNSVELSVTAALPEFDFSLYLNTGSSVSTAYNDRVFVGDKTISSNYYNSASTRNTTSVGLEELFKTSRTNSTGQLTYSIPVPNGVYRVTTYHTEQYYGVVSSGGNGKRVFDINMEGVKVREALDLYQESGNGAVIQVFEDITVFDGVLTIEFNSTVSSPVVSGIAIESLSTLLNARTLTTPTIIASPMEGDGPLKVDFVGDLTGVDQGNLSYSYEFGDGSISTEKNPSHVFMSPGIHDVKVTVKDGKDIITSESLTIQVGKSNEVGFNSDSGFGQTSIRMYPNPASSVVNLQPLDSNIKIGEIAIFDIRGRLIQKYEPSMVQDGNKYSVRVDGLAAGVYLVTTTTESGATQMHRLIVE
ncbi:PKD domain-containing protein [Algoriphagus halophytocola]|uniref:PKD domain-containing protein n=1 Tax=Algoriphagus halophytocola TaxID=2991499 RepID=UPI0022DD8486|nr:PKD domain-containing protein [Algoriphagus sp. TR-M9]WBL41251.1 PKD domain-containing protein [Algoriphagus sp. TR-M9]